MAKLWQRIKNWCIKKLGGYTKEEYGLGPITRYKFIPQQTHGIEVLQAEAEFDSFYKPPTELIEDKLLGGLARQMKPHVVFETCEDYCGMRQMVRATVKVVADNG